MLLFSGETVTLRVKTDFVLQFACDVCFVFKVLIRVRLDLGEAAGNVMDENKPDNMQDIEGGEGDKLSKKQLNKLLRQKKKAEKRLEVRICLIRRVNDNFFGESIYYAKISIVWKE